MGYKGCYEYYYKSPIGLIRIISTGDEVVQLDYVDNNNVSNDSGIENFPGIITKAVTELDDYFKGKLKVFTVNVRQDTTGFRQRVYTELQKIPYGETISYKELALRVGSPNGARAAGGANHNNKINIIVPCHRVIGANGSLVGYGGGLERKKFLLEHEQRNMKRAIV